MAINLGIFSTSSASKIIQVSNQKTHKFRVLSTNVSPSITVRIEFSDDKVNWDNVTTYDCVITENKTTNLITTDVFPVNFLRFVYVSGTGDADVIYTNY